MKVDGTVTHLADARRDLDRLQPDLLPEVALRVRHDEADVLRPVAADELPPELRAAPLEEREEGSVVDVTEGIEVTEEHLVRNDMPAITPLAAELLRDAHCTAALVANGICPFVHACR